MPAVPTDDACLMLHTLDIRGRLTERKARLLCVAVCRRVWHLLGDARSRRAVEVVERYADGMASWAEVEAAAALAAIPANAGSVAVEHACTIYSWKEATAAALTAADAAFAATAADLREGTRTVIMMARLAAEYLASAAAPGETYQQAARVASAAEVQAQLALLGDLFGVFPFPMVAIDPSLLRWDGGTLVKMAATIYDERRWEELPVLGDALEEAGCGDETILQHCRKQEAVHALGCWVLDLLLNKG